MPLWYKLKLHIGTCVAIGGAKLGEVAYQAAVDRLAVLNTESYLLYESSFFKLQNGKQKISWDSRKSLGRATSKKN